jgi:hypothetical protein
MSTRMKRTHELDEDEKQRIRIKNKRGPTLIDKARELLKLAGVRCTIIINEDLDKFTNGRVHMYTNEDGRIEDVLEGYVQHIKTMQPYYIVEDERSDATFVKKHVMKRKTQNFDKEGGPSNGSGAEEEELENTGDADESKTAKDDVVAGTSFSKDDMKQFDLEPGEWDSLFDDHTENTQKYKTGY